MPERRRAILTRLHEALRELALWRCALIWLAGIRRLARLCGSGRRHWIRVRPQPDGHDVHRRSARCGAQRCAVLRDLRCSTRHDIMTTIKAREYRVFPGVIDLDRWPASVRESPASPESVTST